VLGTKASTAMTLTLEIGGWFGVRQERSIMSPFVRVFRAG
jgi:hypothetical protein